MPLDITLTNEQKVLITATPTTEGGQLAMLDGDVTYTVESGECTLESVDNLSTYIVSGDTPGDSVIMVTADADLGEGVQHIQDAVLVHVEGAFASNLGLTAGQPELK